MNNEPVAWLNYKGYLIDDDDVQRYKDEGFVMTPLYTHPAEPKELTIPENSQDWKGMDGATAFWLIERHSNYWGDVRLMMEEWLKANTHPAKTLTDEELNKAFDYYCETDEGVLRFNYELRDKWKKEQLIRWKEAFKKASEK